MKQSRKTYRISYAGAPLVRATASCDGQDGRLFSCENAAAPSGTAFLRAYSGRMCMVWRNSDDKTEFGTCGRTGGTGRSMDGAGGGAGERGGRGDGSGEPRRDRRNGGASGWEGDDGRRPPEQKSTHGDHGGCGCPRYSLLDAEHDNEGNRDVQRSEPAACERLGEQSVDPIKYELTDVYGFLHARHQYERQPLHAERCAESILPVHNAARAHYRAHGHYLRTECGGQWCEYVEQRDEQRCNTCPGNDQRYNEARDENPDRSIRRCSLDARRRASTSTSAAASAKTMRGAYA